MQPVVKVVITAYELFKLDPGMESMYIVSKLRAARVPVLGLFEFKGVEYGKIASYIDHETGNKIIIWEDV